MARGGGQGEESGVQFLVGLRLVVSAQVEMSSRKLPIRI